MNMQDLCRRELVSVNADASVQDAARAMRENHVGALAVTDPYEPGRVIGMITDRDMVIGPLADGQSPAGQPVGALCGTELAGVRATATVPEALAVMRKAGVRRLLVSNDDGSIAGLVSLDDLLDAIAQEFEALAGALRSGIAREAARGQGPQQQKPLYIARNEH
ncbi:Predicted signal-transduction protein containing cAMP-binding and CBS domains [Variovorax sp. HW608]|uniref:CBS domain-containing protein n=1 Tax=Variovorax sp. HW608 TaxID=1034889 RepID=UPI00081FCA57|nr:CBS domain-containing protein [Variovorax sp. HW608]SCK28124.1 Predicted signal-transduction protein containing cAMP-binding and CBS domains [Variovorax sp. HW608]